MKLAKPRFLATPCYWIVDMAKTRARFRDAYIRKCVAKVRSRGLDGLDFGIQLPLTAEQAGMMKEAGLGLCVWTVNEVELAVTLARADVGAITTNWPKKIREGVVRGLRG